MPNDYLELKRKLESLEAAFYNGNFTAVQDFNKYSKFNSRLRVPIYASAPTTAEIGELYANSTNGKLYVCTSANTWTLVGSQT